MRTKENVSVFICDHCKKKLFVRQAMERHEIKCGSNPENASACTGCVHLENIKIPYTYTGSFDGYPIENDMEANGFFCNKLQQKLYPSAIKHKGLPAKYPETFEDQICMPVNCEHFKYFL